MDAICIEQESLTERSVQVLKMKDIYEKATSVHRWLGLPFDYEETEKAVNLMRELNRILHRGLQDHNQDMYAVSATIDDTHHVFPNPGSESYTAWKGIKELFHKHTGSGPGSIRRRQAPPRLPGIHGHMALTTYC